MNLDVRVTGLDEFIRALRGITGDVQSDSGGALKSFADQVADDARSRASSIGSTARHVSGAISVAGGGFEQEVILDGISFPMAAGAEWGAVRYLQFDSFSGDTGYFLHPAATEAATPGSSALDAYGAAIQTIIDQNL